MVKHTTRWSPDTCSCVIEYEWDDAEQTENKTLTLSNYVNRCSIHSTLQNDSDRYTTVQDENKRKNITHGLILENAPSSVFDELIDLDKDNNIVTYRVFKQNVTFSYSWSGTAPDRILNISISGVNLTNPQKNAIRNVLNNRFGINKVVIT